MVAGLQRRWPEIAVGMRHDNEKGLETGDEIQFRNYFGLQWVEGLPGNLELGLELSLSDTILNLKKSRDIGLSPCVSLSTCVLPAVCFFLYTRLKPETLLKGMKHIT